jgi:O-antigen/teichoic acid export membrane protein/aminoglycoside phosphotransferase (APT) family kinase protein
MYRLAQRSVVEIRLNEQVVRLRGHLRTPLYRNAYALTLSSTLTSVIGVGYWVLAARLYPPAVVGLNSAAIAAMMFLAGVAQVNLPSVLVRFIPEAGRGTRRFVGTAYLISGGCAAAAGLVFLWRLDLWAPKLAFLHAGPLMAGWFVAAVAGWSIFVLQDSALTGLRQATWVPIENAGFSVTKVLLLLVFVAWLPSYGVLASWTVGMVATLLPVNLLLFRRLMPQHMARTAGRGATLDPVRVVRYLAGDYLGSLSWLAATMLVPVLVLQVAGPTQNAYFYLCWQIAYALYYVSPNMGSSLIVEVANDPSQLARYSRQVFVQTLRLVVPVVVVVCVGAPLVLRVFGPAYAQHGSLVLRLLALSAIPHIVNTVYVSIARAQRRVGAIAAVLVTLCVLVLALSVLLLPRIGITGVGVAWLVSQTLLALVLLPKQLLPLWTTRHSAGTSGERDGVHVDATTNAPPRTGTARLSSSIIAGGPTSSDGARDDAANRGGDRAAGVRYGARARERLLPLLRHARDFPAQRRWLYTAKRVLPEIVPSIEVLPAMPPAHLWRIQRLVPTATDMSVLKLGPGRQPAVAVLRLPRTSLASSTLERQQHLLTTLHADTRLGAWRTLLPRLLAAGEVRGQVYTVEHVLPGRDARSVYGHPARRYALETAAVATISDLHRCTATTSVLELDAFKAWTDDRLQDLRDMLGGVPLRATYEPALERLAAELREAVVGRRLARSTVHGDFFPGNILVGPDGETVTGIIDWDQGSEQGLPILDVVLLLLSSRMLVQHAQLGSVVRAVLDGAPWTRHEQTLLDNSWAALPGEAIGLRALVLLCWLEHVATTVRTTSRYPRQRLWVAYNIERVLEGL